MISDANKAVNDLASIVPLLGGSSSRKDYEEARKLVEYLLEHDPGSPLVDMLTARIDAWEDNAVEFEEFNTRFEAGKKRCIVAAGSYAAIRAFSVRFRKRDR